MTRSGAGRRGDRPPRPLAGRTVLVTRPADQSAALVTLLTATGCSCDRGAGDRDRGRRGRPPSPGRCTSSHRGDFAWLTLTSRATVDMLASRLPGPRAIGDTEVAAIGDGTAAAFRRWARRDPDLVPPTFTTTGLARAFPRGSGRVLCARADIAPPGLEDALAAEGLDPHACRRLPHPLPSLAARGGSRGAAPRRGRRGHVHERLDRAQASSARSGWSRAARRSCASARSPRGRRARTASSCTRSRGPTRWKAWPRRSCGRWHDDPRWRERARRRYPGAMSFPEHRPRRLRRTPALRALVRETRLHADDLIVPMFCKEGIDEPVRDLVDARAVPAHPRVAAQGSGRDGGDRRPRVHALRGPGRRRTPKDPRPGTPTASASERSRRCAKSSATTRS